MSDKPDEFPEIATAEIVGGVDSLKQAIATSEKYLGNWQRTQADFDNYKKRMAQEREEYAKFASTNFIRKLLLILDDFELAFKSIPPDMAENGWAEGFKLILQKLQKTLESEGVSEIKATGETFDPTCHEAVMQGEGEEDRSEERCRKATNYTSE